MPNIWVYEMVPQDFVHVPECCLGKEISVEELINTSSVAMLPVNEWHYGLHKGVMPFLRAIADCQNYFSVGISFKQFLIEKNTRRVRDGLFSG